MEEDAKVRVVRCPNCGKLLPEVADIPVYRCGGCNATLQSRKKTTETSSCSSSSKSESKDGLSDSNGGRYDRQRKTHENTNGDQYRHPSKGTVQNLSSADLNNTEKLIKTNVEGYGKANSQFENSVFPQEFRQTPDPHDVERERMLAFQRMPRAVVEGVHFSRYPDEGLSNYDINSDYGFGEPTKNQNVDGSDRVGYFEQDPAEILRQINELKDKLSRSCDVSERPKERVPMSRRTIPSSSYIGRNNWISEGSNNQIRRPPHFGNEHIPLMTNQYPPMHPHNEMLGYQPSQYPQIPSYMEIDPDPVHPYTHNAVYHQPACSCFHCYNKHLQVPLAQVPPAAFYDRRFPNSAAPNHMFYHADDSSTYGSRGPILRGVNNAPLYPHDPHARWPTDLDSEMGGFVRSRPRRSLLENGNLRRCQPISGGAPFITCPSCFELLQLPRKLVLIKKNSLKLRCEACCKVISVALNAKRLIVSVPMQAKHLQVEAENHSGGINSHSDDPDNSNLNIQSMDNKPILPFHNLSEMSKECGLNLSESEKIQGFSSFSTSSEDEESPDSMVPQRDVSNSSELPLKAIATSPLPGSPLHENFGYEERIASNQVVSKLRNGNWSKRVDHEKVVSTMESFKQNSVKDSSAATEIDFSSNEYTNSGLSQDSGDTSKEQDRPRIGKGGNSFFSGFMKKSFREFSRSSQTSEDGIPNVLVNGQPIPDRLVKKAEKLAGPIQPGQYWYDYQAGFWGVMGQPCLGIIPPFIEEFKYPLPKNCSAGNTGCFVNGRELHQKDFDLLVSRGLPETRDKSYIVEISGRVTDEASGEELDTLGKLAPTVQKRKHGFGMRVPRSMQ